MRKGRLGSIRDLIVKTFAMAVAGWSSFALALVLLGAPNAAHAIVEKPGPGEPTFEQTYADRVAPFFETGFDGLFLGAQGRYIRYRKFEVPNDRGAIVVVNGRTETFLKYAEVVYDLSQLLPGYSIYLYDHRGQGLSERLIRNPLVGHVDRYDDYIADLKTFIDQVVKAVPHPKTVLLAHSMGGAIASLYAERYAGDVSALVLSAPMLEINTKPYPAPVAYAIARTFDSIGRGRKYAPGQGNPKKDESIEHYAGTHSAARFAKIIQLCEEHTETVIGGPSNRWVRRSIEATRKIAKGVVRQPVLLFQAGADSLVKPGGQNRLCKRALSCEKITFPGSWHEILMERDEIRTPAMNKAAEFISRVQ